MKSTDAKLTKKWKCNIRTLYRWRQEGAPLADDAKMRIWLSTRKNLPRATAVVINAMREICAPIDSRAVDHKKGLPAALERLEQSEATAFEAFQVAIKSGDVVTIKSARRNWLELVENLRKSDESVDENKRSAGELLPREQFERALWGISHCINLGFRTISYRITDEKRNQLLPDNPTKIYKIMHEIFNVAIAGNLFDLPDWAVKSLTSVTPFTGTTEWITKAGEVIEVLVKHRDAQLGPDGKAIDASQTDKV